jgi:hypothetical protein
MVELVARSKNASNRTAVLVLQKGQSTEYPSALYCMAQSVEGERFTYDSTLDEVRAAYRTTPRLAR